MSFSCYACRQPVSGLATRCPHCTTAINMGGGRDRSQDYAHLQPIYVSKESQDWAFSLVFGTIFKTAVIVGLAYWFWDDLVSIFNWLENCYYWIKSVFHSVFYSLLVWLFG